MSKVILRSTKAYGKKGKREVTLDLSNPTDQKRRNTLVKAGWTERQVVKSDAPKPDAPKEPTKDEIIKELTELGAEFDKSATKSVLATRLAKAREEAKKVKSDAPKEQGGEEEDQ